MGRKNPAQWCICRAAGGLCGWLGFDLQIVYHLSKAAQPFRCKRGSLLVKRIGSKYQVISPIASFHNCKLAFASGEKAYALVVHLFAGAAQVTAWGLMRSKSPILCGSSISGCCRASQLAGPQLLQGRSQHVLILVHKRFGRHHVLCHLFVICV